MLMVNFIMMKHSFMIVHVSVIKDFQVRIAIMIIEPIAVGSLIEYAFNFFLVKVIETNSFTDAYCANEEMFLDLKLLTVA